MANKIDKNKLKDEASDYNSKVASISDTKNDSVPDIAPRSSYSTDVQYIDTTVPLLAEILKILHTHEVLLHDLIKTLQLRNKW